MTDMSKETPLVDRLWESDGASALTNEAAREIERLRGALRDVRTFLANPEWGTVRYMEGSYVYTDKNDALRTIAVALGDEDVSDEQ